MKRITIQEHQLKLPMAALLALGFHSSTHDDKFEPARVRQCDPAKGLVYQGSRFLVGEKEVEVDGHVVRCAVLTEEQNAFSSEPRQLYGLIPMDKVREVVVTLPVLVEKEEEQMSIEELSTFKAPLVPDGRYLHLSRLAEDEKREGDTGWFVIDGDSADGVYVTANGAVVAGLELRLADLNEGETMEWPDSVLLGFGTGYFDDEAEFNAEIREQVLATVTEAHKAEAVANWEEARAHLETVEESTAKAKKGKKS